MNTSNNINVVKYKNTDLSDKLYHLYLELQMLY